MNGASSWKSSYSHASEVVSRRHRVLGLRVVVQGLGARSPRLGNLALRAQHSEQVPDLRDFYDPQNAAITFYVMCSLTCSSLWLCDWLDVYAHVYLNIYIYTICTYFFQYINCIYIYIYIYTYLCICVCTYKAQDVWLRISGQLLLRLHLLHEAYRGLAGSGFWRMELFGCM